MLLMTKVISVQKITRIYKYLEVALGCNFCEQSPFLKGNTACDDMSLVRGEWRLFNVCTMQHYISDIISYGKDLYIMSTQLTATCHYTTKILLVNNVNYHMPEYPCHCQCDVLATVVFRTVLFGFGYFFL